jgi:hypothetical protein
VRHEEEAYLAAAPWTHTLKQRGYQVVRSLLPISLMTDVLIYEGLPPDAVEVMRCRVMSCDVM